MLSEKLIKPVGKTTSNYAEDHDQSEKNMIEDHHRSTNKNCQIPWLDSMKIKKPFKHLPYEIIKKKQKTFP